MPILSDDARAKVLSKGQLVYTAYAALNLATDPCSKINIQGRFFNEYLQDLIKNKQFNANLNLDGSVYKIKLVATSTQHYQVVITDQEDQPIPPLPVTKALDDYTITDAMALWANHSLVVNMAHPLKLALTYQNDQTTYQIGGDKIDLYSIHIRNLYQMLQHLSDPQVLPHVLIEMATGSGKSYTQALWWMVLHLAGIPAIFSAPSALLTQALKAEFHRLLPADIANAADITTHTDLLSTRWPTLKQQDGDVFVSVDEQHEAMREELFARRLQWLSARLPLVLLTATPTDSVYALVAGPAPEKKNDAVIMLSRAAKENLGLAQRAKNISSTAGRILDRFGPATFTWRQRLSLAIAESLEPERTSAAHNYVEEVEKAYSIRDTTNFRVDPNEVKFNDEVSLRHYLRWTLESPLGEKALVHATSHDAVVNMTIVAKLKGKENIWNERKGSASTIMKEDAYRRGNRVPREDVYQVLQLDENLDAIHREKHKISHLQQRQQMVLNLTSRALDVETGSEAGNCLQQAIQTHVSFSDHSHYLDHRVHHGLLEQALSYLTGYDSVKLDRKRRDNLTLLVSEVGTKLGELKLERYDDIQKELTSGLSDWLIKQGLLADPPLINQVAVLIATMIFIMAKEQDPAALSGMVDNWQLDKILHEKVFTSLTSKLYEQGVGWREIVNVQPLLESYLEKHRTVYVMRNLECAETPIQSGKPFYGLEATAAPFKRETAKRKLGIFEQMNPYLSQFSYQPLALTREQKEEKQYQPAAASPYPVETVDALFKMGLVGCYVTNDKIVGFNDQNLQHVGILIDSNEDLLNQPDVLIQAAGRNRGLNPARRPYCITSADYGVTLTFDPRELERGGARRAYWKAKQAYHKQLINQLRIQLSEEIQFFIEKNLTVEQELDEAALQEHCTQILLNGFDRLYKNNEHHFAKTRREFVGLLKSMQKQLVHNTAAIQKTYHNPIFVKIIGTLSNAMATIILYFKTWSSRSQLAAALREEGRAAPPIHRTYAHIIASYSYKETSRVRRLGLTLAQLMAGKVESVMLKIAAAPERYLKTEVRENNSFDANFKNKIAPILLQHVANPEHRAALQERINRKTWLNASAQFFVKNQDQLTQLGSNADLSQYVELIFKPLLLQDADIAAYVEEKQVIFDKDFLKSKADYIEKAVENMQTEAKQLQKKAADTKTALQVEMKRFGKEQQQEMESSVQAFQALTQRTVDETARAYQAEAKALSAKIAQEMRVLAQSFDPFQQKDVFSFMRVLVKGAQVRSGSSEEMNEFFKTKILHDCFCPILDRQSKAVVVRVLNKPYDWSKSLLKNKQFLESKQTDEIKKLELLISETVTDRNDRADMLKIMQGLDMGAAQASHKPPAVAKAAILERMELPLQGLIMPSLLNSFFNDADKAVLQQVMSDYFSRHGLLTDAANRELLEEIVNPKQQGLSEEERLVESREHLSHFFCNLVSPEDKQTTESITTIMETFPFSKLYYNFNLKLQQDLFPRLASLMSDGEGQRFVELTSKYHTWGRQLCTLLHDTPQMMDDPEAIAILIERVVSDVEDRQALLALLAANNEAGFKKKFFLQFVTRFKDDVVSILPDHSPIKQRYLAQQPTIADFQSSLASVYDASGDVGRVLEEAKVSPFAGFDFVATVLGKALPAAEQGVEAPAQLLQQARDAIKENRAFAEQLKDNLNQAEIRRLLVLHLQPLFADQVYKENMKAILGPLNQKHVLTILNALYPKQDNRANTKLLFDYQRDLFSLPKEQLLNKYLDWNNQETDVEKQFKASRLFLVNQLALAVLDEVRACQEYFYNSASPVVPQLKKADYARGEGATIWGARTPTSENLRAALKVRSMQGFVEMYPSLNRLEALKKQTETRQSLRVAQTLGRLSDDLTRRGPVASTTRFALFANTMKQADGLTPDEVLDERTQTRSAVDKLRQVLKPQSA